MALSGLTFPSRTGTVRFQVKSLAGLVQSGFAPSFMARLDLTFGCPSRNLGVNQQSSTPAAIARSDEREFPTRTAKCLHRRYEPNNATRDPQFGEFVYQTVHPDSVKRLGDIKEHCSGVPAFIHSLTYDLRDSQKLSMEEK
ncbi:hypothetical protein AVEN_210515-1 [Araneus ventricosus]|uniref:Uncharacterized protein n=1 Tax=Araneus ventricosus TaxID=182803 RepID=A0A4Y2FDK7_ARAVE|nr:hypothetical protein AVEN_210515-1 [Araneus ventricosus]